MKFIEINRQIINIAYISMVKEVPGMNTHCDITLNNGHVYRAKASYQELIDEIKRLEPTTQVGHLAS